MPSTGKTPRRGRQPLDDAPRHDVPYFAHETLNPEVYPPGESLRLSPQGSTEVPRSPVQLLSWRGRLKVFLTPALAMPVGGPRPAPRNDSRGAASEGRRGRAPDPIQWTSSYNKFGKRQIEFPIDPKKQQAAHDTRPAAPKRVSWDLDSDDETIFRMKKDKFTDAEIADHLRDSGRVRYHHKTINSRYSRILKAIDAHEEKRLDLGETTWHADDDARLVQAVADAETDMEEQKRKIDKKKWDTVAKLLRSGSVQGWYSGGACKKRYEALETETASIPPEVDNRRTRTPAQPDQATSGDPESSFSDSPTRSGTERLEYRTREPSRLSTGETLSSEGPHPARDLVPSDIFHPGPAEVGDFGDRAGEYLTQGFAKPAFPCYSASRAPPFTHSPLTGNDKIRSPFKLPPLSTATHERSPSTFKLRGAHTVRKTTPPPLKSLDEQAASFIAMEQATGRSGPSIPGLFLRSPTPELNSEAHHVMEGSAETSPGMNLDPLTPTIDVVVQKVVQGDRTPSPGLFFSSLSPAAGLEHATAAPAIKAEPESPAIKASDHPAVKSSEVSMEKSCAIKLSQLPKEMSRDMLRRLFEPYD
ncbi:MAG: hypothetical protein M1832_003408 [Thelocarpon impressellum]|nr:MAG: hypothetical protein M1832_003408 [Thelocarpon impressellum]